MHREKEEGNLLYTDLYVISKKYNTYDSCFCNRYKAMVAISTSSFAFSW